MNTTLSDRGETNEEPWYRQAFEASYLALYAHRNLADAQRAIKFVQSVLSPQPTDRLLDLCCGAGRHLSLLAECVALPIGMDLSRALLSRAKESIGDEAEIVQGDMSRLPFRSSAFDWVVNLFTSFGYFQSDAENFGVFEEVARVLKPGGKMVMDHINRPSLLASLVPESERNLEDGSIVRETRMYDAQKNRIEKKVEHIKGDGAEPAFWHESVRVFDSAEIDAAVATFGLRMVERFGSFEKEPLGEHSPRMILLIEKNG